MFKHYLNNKEASSFAKSFRPSFKFKNYKEHRDQGTKNYDGKTWYIAKDENNDWKLSIAFRNRLYSGRYVKSFYPEINFIPSVMLSDEEIQKESKNIIEYLDRKYTPDYNQITKIVERFVEKGLNSGLFYNVEYKKHAKEMNTYVALNNDLKILEFKDKNIATVSYNNILQKRTSKNPDCLKKSYISVKLIHLIHYDESIQPYFLIKLPYTANKKISCVISLTNADKVYYAATDEPFKTGYLIKLNTINMNNIDLAEFFETLFKREARNILKETLDMHTYELYELNVTELRNYLKIAEMVKV